MGSCAAPGQPRPGFLDDIGDHQVSRRPVGQHGGAVELDALDLGRGSSTPSALEVAAITSRASICARVRWTTMAAGTTVQTPRGGGSPLLAPPRAARARATASPTKVRPSSHGHRRVRVVEPSTRSAPRPSSAGNQSLPAAARSARATPWRRPRDPEDEQRHDLPHHPAASSLVRDRLRTKCTRAQTSSSPSDIGGGHDRAADPVDATVEVDRTAAARNTPAVRFRG